MKISGFLGHSDFMCNQILALKRLQKLTFFAVLKALNIDFGKFLPSKISKKHQIQNLKPLNLSNGQLWNF